MAQVKSELFTNDLIEQANFFKALLHPARIHILNFSAQPSSCTTNNSYRSYMS